MIVRNHQTIISDEKNMYGKFEPIFYYVYRFVLRPLMPSYVRRHFEQRRYWATTFDDYSGKCHPTIDISLQIKSNYLFINYKSI